MRLDLGRFYQAVTVNDQTVTVNLAGIPAGTAATLVLRLVNNDSDTQTSVQITDIAVTAADVEPPSGVTPALAALEPSPEIDFDGLSDVSSSMTVEYGQTSLNDGRDRLFADVTVQNTGTYGVDGPLVVAVANINDPTVQVLDADGFTPDGLPYYVLTLTGDEGTLEPGDTSGEGTLVFANPGGEQFTYDLVVLGHLNEAPEIVTEPNLEGIIGRPYRYDVDAIDPEDDPVTYSLVAAPVGMEIDEITGEIEWNPEEADRGTQSITVQASDGRGGVTEQSFDLVVGNALPNRPPVFTTGPVVDARVNTAYEYDADATDLDGDDLTYALVDRPDGMEIDPATGGVSWTPTTEQVNGEETAEVDSTLPVVEGFTTSIYVEQSGLDPTKLSFDPAGTLYVGRDNSGSGGNVTDAVRIHKIAPGSKIVEEFGDTGISDPDVVLFDKQGLVSGVPGAVIVGGGVPGMGRRLSAILPDGSVNVLFTTGNGNLDISSMILDQTGRLLFTNENQVFVVENGVPSLLFESPVGGLDDQNIAVDGNNRIYSGDTDGVIRVYDANGQLLDDAFATGLGTAPILEFGPGGIWGNDLYAINRNSGELIRIDLDGNQAVIGDGFSNTFAPDITFGPDNALYLNDFEGDRILRIAPDRETLGLDPSEHPVTITVADGKGGVAIQNYVVNVLPEEGNHEPVIVSEPIIELTIPPHEPAELLGPTPYLSFEDSPFIDIDFSSFYLEDFEDGLLNTPGVEVFSISGEPTVIEGPRSYRDSVDADDGLIDGFGNNGYGLYEIGNGGDGGFSFEFDENALGTLPTHVGIVWTDSHTNSSILDGAPLTFEAFDAQGKSLGTIDLDASGIGDGTTGGTTGDDRFFGAIYLEGISSIAISQEGVIFGIEVDHLQYGTTNLGSLSNLPSYVYDVNAIDPDNDALTYSFVEAPQGMDIDDKTGVISWLPTVEAISDVDEVAVTVRAEDGRGGSDEQSFSIELVETLEIDLAIAEVTPDNLAVNGQALALTGSVSAEITNQGNNDLSQPFDVLFFEDTNTNQTYDEGIDSVLGRTTVTDSLAAGVTQTVTADLSGMVSFLGVPIWAFVDSGNAVVETDETNNLAFNSHDCIEIMGEFDPVVEWNKKEFTVEPNSSHVAMTPAVIDVNEDNIPDIIFSTFADKNFVANGKLRAISGADGSEIWTVTDPEYEVNPSDSIAVGDIDNDGQPEVIAKHESGGFIAFENDGTFKWKSGTILNNPRYSGTSIADLDQDGTPEIIVGASVLDNQGNLVWKGNTFHGLGRGQNGFGPLSVVADLDLDGSPEVVAGKTAYRADGSIYWHSTIPDGFPAIGNFDDDPNPEIVLIESGRLHLLEHNGEVKWGGVALPGRGRGGGPVVADLDGDGEPEIGLAGLANYVVFESDGSLKWQSPISGSSSATGASAFDFNGDGRLEIVYGDQFFLRIYDGSNGDVLYELPKSSVTTTELPVIADVDADGNAEIVAVANQFFPRSQQNGILVIGDRNSTWAPTRQIWNQHSYHITNVNDDGTIPIQEENSWQVHNTYRVNTLPEANAILAPDLIPSYVRLDDFETNTIITARIGNGGSQFVAEGVSIAFYRGDPRNGGVLLGTSQTTMRLDIGAFEDVSLAVPADSIELEDIWVVADQNDTGQGFVNECDEENNFYQVILAKSNEIRGTKYLDLDGDGNRNLEQQQELINLSSNAFYNSSLGDLYPGDPNDPLAEYFPGPNRSTGDPLANFSEAPDLSSISNLGNWLNNPKATIENSEFWTEVQPVPDTWTVNNETAIIYEIDAGEGTITNLIGDFGVDNGIHVWLDGNYLFGAMRGGPAEVGEYSIGPIDLSPGKHYLQVLREDHGGATGYTVSVTGDDRIEPGLEDWIIYIDANDNGQRDDNELFTRTDSEGHYTFEDLASGTYIIREENQIGYVQTFPEDFKHVVTVVDGDIVEGIDFGNFKGIIPNAEPEFTSTPPKVATVNQRFRYDADAQDTNGDLLTYDLSLAPEGMVVDPTSGILVWEPSINQIGIHDVILRVQDGNGGVDLQPFQINVNNNNAPVITSRPFGPTIANIPYTYAVNAEDTDGDTLTYSLLANPDGVTIDDTTGVLSWTPTDSDVGGNFIRVQVADGQGGLDTQSFTLPVIASTAVNNPPVITNMPRSAIGLGDDYIFQIEASDPDNDALTYSLLDKPDGMTIDETGLITWPAAQTQLGDYSFTVRVEDSRGAAVEATYTVTVGQQTANQGPTIISTPSLVATIGDQYIYDAEATDPDNDPIAWSLVSGPVGLSLDTATGQVKWTPTADQVGPHEVIIDAIDAQGSSFRQGFGLNVSSTNAPPVITSPPLTLAVSNADYSHTIEATDPNGDALTYSLTIAPTGMTIDESTGQIDWTPTSAQQGTQQVTVSVTDGQSGFAEQSYTVDVIGDAPNQPPQFTSRPAFAATANQDYTYQLTATDPENLTLRYELLDGPANMTVDETTGVLTWTPTADQLGPHTIQVAAFDPLDLGASQTFTVTVGSGNQQPVLNNAPVTTAIANQLYAFDLNVTDPDGDAVTYTLENGPDGMTIDELGRVRWTSTVEDVGTEPIRITFRDAQGPGRFINYDLNVIADTTAPQVALVVNENPVDLGEPVIIQVQAVDDVAIDSIGLTVDGEDIALDSNGAATLTFNQFSNISLMATAVDTSGNEATTDLVLEVRDSSDTEAPVVAFTRLEDSDNPGEALIDPDTGNPLVTSFADIIGTVDDLEDNLTSFKLTATPFAGGATTTLATGTSEIIEDVLGEFDGTLLRNDTYVLELSAEDAGGNESSTSILVDVEGDLKIGNYTLSFVDLSIPLTGIPIVVSRTYDTLNANISDDFGHGWSMDLRDTDLTDNVGESGLEDSGIYNAFFDGAAVYVTLPNGEREKFIFQPQARGLFGLTTYKPRFVAADGDNTSTLTVDDIDLQRTADGRYVTLSQIPYNPASTLISSLNSGNYTLTTKDGIKYTIDANSGDLEKVTDRNGNTLTYEDAGVFSSTGKQVTFKRDTQGRITAIIDPEGKRITYEYDELGDLVAVTDREDNTTRFDYDDDIPHFLEDVIDPLQRPGIRSEYQDGRLVKLFDFEGNEVELIHDPANFVETVKDQFDNLTVYEYDARGNVLTEIDALGGITRRTYDDTDNILTETIEKDGVIYESTTFTYDSQNNILTETNALGYKTTFTYDSFGNVLTTTDPTGQTITNTYDARGNLTKITGQATGPIEFEYETNGNLKSLKDSVGTTTFRYDAAGNLERQEDALGTVTTYTYDPNGNQETETTTQTTPNGVVTLVTKTEYDNEGRVIKVTDAENNVTEMKYDANGNLIEEINARQQSTQYIYDERGQLVETIYPDETPDDLSDNPRTRTEYDEAGRVIAEYDELNQVTRTVYDKLGRVTETIFADDTPDNPDDNPHTRTKYDPAGRVIAQIDERENRTEFVYDAAGRLIETIYPDGTPDNPDDNPRFTTTYDKVGRQIYQTDALNQRTQFLYDELGRSVGQKYADGTTSSVEYDSAGRIGKQIDQEGNATEFKYDALGRLTTVIDALQKPTEYSYDEQSNLITQKDANGNITRYEYDKLGRRTATVLPEGQRSGTRYDPLGNSIRRTDFNNDVTNYVYDERNRLTAKDLPGTEFDESYTYYDNGLLESVIDGRGTTYTYDERNRLSQRQDPDGTTIAYSYDKAGNRTSVAIPSGTTTYTFDEQNRLKTVTDPDDGVTEYFYNAVGNLERTEFPNGTAEIREYDTLNRLEYIENSGPNGIINSFRYTLNDAGHRTAVDEHDGRRVEYTYDDLYRLEKETIYDPGATAPSHTIEYIYDDVGNRLSRDDSAEGKTIYTYDNNDRLETATRNGIVTTYGYDNNGNTTSKVTNGTTITYNWNADNRLISADTDGDGALDVVNQYNQNGIRVSQTVNGEETRFLIDENRPYAQVLEEYTTEGIIKVSYVHGNDLISQNREDTSSFYHVDGLGSVRATSNLDVTSLNQYTYDAFGTSIQTSGVNKNDYLFAGEQQDVNLSLQYLRARYYDASIGRFISTDPFEGRLSQPVSLHNYQYANNNPSNGIDPSGLVTLLSQITAVQIRTELATAFSNAGRTTIQRTARITDRLLIPGQSMQEVGLKLTIVGDPRGFTLYQIGRNVSSLAFRGLSGAVGLFYKEVVDNLTTSALGKTTGALSKPIQKLNKKIQGSDFFDEDKIINRYIEAIENLIRDENIQSLVNGTKFENTTFLFTKGTEGLEAKFNNAIDQTNKVKSFLDNWIKQGLIEALKKEVKSHFQ